MIQIQSIISIIFCIGMAIYFLKLERENKESQLNKALDKLEEEGVIPL